LSGDHATTAAITVAEMVCGEGSTDDRQSATLVLPGTMLEVGVSLLRHPLGDTARVVENADSNRRLLYAGQDVGFVGRGLSMLLDRMMRAARLDVNLYEEVEADLGATSQAATVVGIVALCGGIGSATGLAMTGEVGLAVGAFIGGIVFAFIGWIAWSYITYWVGTSMFKAQATPGELLRAVGFAQTPGVLNILSFIPILGGIISFAAAIWALVAGVIALRQALDISTGQAIITAIIGMIPMMLLACLSGIIFGGGAAILGAAGR